MRKREIIIQGKSEIKYPGKAKIYIWGKKINNPEAEPSAKHLGEEKST
jgi:hypothetical protein